MNYKILNIDPVTNFSGSPASVELPTDVFYFFKRNSSSECLFLEQFVQSISIKLNFIELIMFSDENVYGKTGYF